PQTLPLLKEDFLKEIPPVVRWTKGTQDCIEDFKAFKSPKNYAYEYVLSRENILGSLIKDLEIQLSTLKKEVILSIPLFHRDLGQEIHFLDDLIGIFKLLLNSQDSFADFEKQDILEAKRYRDVGYLREVRM